MTFCFRENYFARRSGSVVVSRMLLSDHCFLFVIFNFIKFSMLIDHCFYDKWITRWCRRVEIEEGRHKERGGGPNQGGDSSPHARARGIFFKSDSIFVDCSKFIFSSLLIKYFLVFRWWCMHVSFVRALTFWVHFRIFKIHLLRLNDYIILVLTVFV